MISGGRKASSNGRTHEAGGASSLSSARVYKASLIVHGANSRCVPRFSSDDVAAPFSRSRACTPTSLVTIEIEHVHLENQRLAIRPVILSLDPRQWERQTEKRENEGRKRKETPRYLRSESNSSSRGAIFFQSWCQVREAASPTVSFSFHLWLIRKVFLRRSCRDLWYRASSKVGRSSWTGWEKVNVFYGFCFMVLDDLESIWTIIRFEISLI